ncbi:MAG: CDGSH iron-sulfur domain-containing protein [Chloroflexi bacterium]|nr:CDGSH iron-sulfur domain-containing protein [Chloroflexota bacterium]
MENGPYIVSGGVPLTVQKIVLDADGQCLTWAETRQYLERQNYSLCRCGKSKNKPFCDGTHTKINFDGTEIANRRIDWGQCETYTGPALDLKDVKVLCAHAGFCNRANGIWNLVSRSDDSEAQRIAIEEACRCPSGRLVLFDKGGKVIEPVLEPSIVVVESPSSEFIGSIWVRGGIPVVSVKGEVYETRNRVTLCGCGRSLNKPFCDGKHRQKNPTPT